MTNSTARQQNPYVIGRPLNEPQLFFGREGLFRFIKDNLSQNEQVILLHGQRRIGKSSIILNISNFVAPDKFVFVSFDLEHYSREPLSGFLSALATAIIEQLNLSSDKITLPSITELKTKRDVFYSQFLPQVYEALGDKKLVLLLDEFDALSNDYSDSLIEHFFPYLRSIIKLHDKLSIILFVGRQSTVRPNLLSLFKGAPYEEIGLLDELSAKRLITEPAKGILEYDPEALKAILELSAGHPYFTQVICFALFGRARERENWKVSREDVKGIIDKAIENAEAGLAWFWDGLSEPEQLVFSAVAEAQRKMEQDQGFPEDPLVLLKSYGVIQTEPLAQAAKQLVDTSFLDNTGQRVKIEFVRRWLLQRHPLKQEIRNLKKLEQQQVNFIKQITATPPHQQGEKQNQSDPNEQVLKPSPNHVSRPNPETRLPKPKLILFGNMAIVAAITALVSIGIDRRWGPYLEGNQKMPVVSCIAHPNRISYGGCTFFPKILIPNRDQGIQAFNTGNYVQAAQFFQKAVNNNHKDPEVLIYYNNALAKQKVSPLTLAVIVPVPPQNPELELSSKAQEILRGVAQAQDKFNKEPKAKEQLLEIAIANDADQSDQAEQVAAELVKDKNVLGVIGHYSSQATQKALPKYEQAGLPIISPSSTSTELKSKVFFSAAPSDKASGEKLAKYAFQDLKIKKVVIFNNPDIYSKSIQKTFTDEFKSQGGQVVREILLTEELDAKTEVENSLKGRAQAAVLFPDTQPQHIRVALKIAKANAEWMANPQNTNKSGLKLLGGDALYGNTTLSEGKEAVEDMILVVPWFRDDPKSKDFAQKADKQWGGSVSWLTAAGFDTTQAFIKALLSSPPNPSRATVLQKLRSVNLPASTTSGEALKFTSDGERDRKPILVKIERGKYKLVK